MLPSLTQEIHAIYVIIMVYTLYDDSNAKKFEFIELIHLYNSPIDNKLELSLYPLIYRTFRLEVWYSRFDRKVSSSKPPVSYPQVPGWSGYNFVET